MKKHSTKKALIASVLTLALCFTSLIGTTFAWFTDSVSNTGNVIQTGTLDVEFWMYNATTDEYEDISNETDPIFGADGLIDQWETVDTVWEPGKTQIVYLAVKNAGSLALKYNIIVDVVDLGLVGALEYAIVDGATKTDADALNLAKWADITAISGVQSGLVAAGRTVAAENGAIVNKDEYNYFALAIHMDEDANNDYQDKSVVIDINILATQLSSEKDSFDDNGAYDNGATFPAPIVAYSKQAVDPAEDLYELPLTLPTGGTAGNVEIKPASVDPEATSVAVKVFETKLYENYTVQADMDAKTYDIEVYGVDEGNTTPIRVNLYVGEGLTGVTLYHYSTPVPGAIYNEVTGVVTFETTEFSPFTVEFDAPDVEAGPAPEKPETPLTAIVKDMDKYENVNLTWDPFGPFSALPNGYRLESVYEFTSPDSKVDVANSYYKNWWCDYYVMMDRDVAEGALLLGGNYGDWGWVGFTNPIAVEAGVEVPLLGFALNPENPRVDTITYEGVVNFVETFICGVAHTDASLNGATFTVMLRLTNPEDFSDSFNAAVVEYTFDDAPMNWEDYKDMPAYVETTNEEEE